MTDYEGVPKSGIWRPAALTEVVVAAPVAARYLVLVSYAKGRLADKGK